MDLQKVAITITELASVAQNIKGEILSNLTSFLKKNTKDMIQK